MNRIRLACLAVAGLLGSSWAAGQEVVSYEGICDASAAVALDADHFVVADDEHNTLQIYRRGAPGPVGSLNLERFLATEKESDLEGAATLGGVTYWIASHGRNAEGKLRKDRQRLFATEVVPRSPTPTLRPVGNYHHTLLKELTEAAALKPYALKAASKLAPEAPGGLNIEGLAATPDGRLLIGFRNPIPPGGALVVPIENPRAMLAGKPVRIGKPIELPLGQRGIRSIELVGSQYLIVAGPPADAGSFALYRWSGSAGDKPVSLAVDLGTLSPEALFAIPGTQSVQILSDDGGVTVSGKACKDQPKKHRSFRSITVKL